MAVVLLVMLWRALRVLLVAFAAIGPGPPPPPPPPPPLIELREEGAQKLRKKAR
ncbi:MAG TPA: hypothetical protein VGK73_39250 [Polyangiaceae bacterium]